MIVARPSIWRFVALLLVTFSLASPVMAEKKEKTPKFIEFSGIAFPIIENNVLKQYVFIRFRVDIKTDDTARISKIYYARPFMRDTIIRASYQVYLGVPSKTGALDRNKLNALIKSAWRQYLDPNDMGQIVILETRPGPLL